MTFAFFDKARILCDTFTHAKCRGSAFFDLPQTYSRIFSHEGALLASA